MAETINELQAENELLKRSLSDFKDLIGIGTRGFKDLGGVIELNKSFKKGTPITTLSINIKNICLEDIDIVISELEKQKVFLSQYKNKEL